MIGIEILLGFIREDAPFGDATSAAIIPDITCMAQVRAKAAGIAAGLEEAQALFDHFGATVRLHAADGCPVGPGDLLMEIEGPAAGILLVERTALNIIGRMSGIATKTRRLADRIAAINPSVRIAATRKTAPGCRLIDKKAVIIGGGDPHRITLSDQVLIKDNHLAIVGLEEAIRRARAWSTYRIVEVEVETAADALKAARAGAHIVLLDNMSPAAVAATAELLVDHGLRDQVTLEVSGGIDEESVTRYAGLDVDVISMGGLTHSVANLDVSLSVIPGARSFTL
jgi:nicotinate-nucleotide pyrophosphorylase (carboxylating)